MADDRNPLTRVDDHVGCTICGDQTGSCDCWEVVDDLTGDGWTLEDAARFAQGDPRGEP